MEQLLSKCPPSRSFRPAGQVECPRLELKSPPWIGQSTKNSAKLAGLRYERQAKEFIRNSFPRLYVEGPWFSFTNGGDTPRRYCQPDFLLLDFLAGTLVVGEIKLRHTAGSWWQVEHLYLPVVRAIFGGNWKYSAFEMCHWYDPAVAFPVRCRLLEQPRYTAERFGVFIWKPGE